ncbi:UDP-N-acetyl-D-mannosamine dehydrogenase [Acinetobacter baumannii]|uniref:UDP-N-acetyl-D-mannosamine dehydrogenase n=1 Tax=Acinetobacter calcoaceticus/baumannii complex TaxID=909768 RepID=UPI000DE7B149|nr:UDP-N-acetyl-D-mannosamine dehydrogenase [Acinetobacter baumannii]MCW1513851.1 UDP-N-acetyl-D-mannosamine dehydrogenase [Acinetobacter baumannii]MDC4537419.1 UDP-N-acetyl-D-mannosamine dehydrogenase [Acinetobacter baumannii]MDV7434715.1 UDP-N-acetyl-D-mannosamine dehydrogenase [Acinetobacter baumannii]TNW40665.1 UDP-N-acetyl-D-mannosamine dehydrogenase [Acinetobacter baumannii]SSQ33108.1 UDP-glucose 6-dehydrogenase [Acinetobacter baumannii]
MSTSFKHICVIGLGYIGLPTAATFAAHGIKVTGVDVNQHAVDMINQGKVHIIEPDLDALVRDVVAQGKLSAQTIPTEANAYIVAVPTPFKDDYQPDLKYIEAASKAIAPFLKKGNLVILESTSPVEATEQMAAWLSDARPDLSFPQQKGEEADILVAHCPERVLPGKVLQELISNDRIIGGMTPRCSKAASELYQIFVKGDCIETNARTAEMCKLTENSFRDVNIAFANELSMICNKLNINVWELISLANRHPRVNILQPGPGVGGHCIAVDPWFIVAKTPEQAQLIRAAREVNDSKPEWVINQVKIKIADFLQSNPTKTIKDITIACYGLAFKPDIDDLRESPALEITKKLAEQGLNILAIEPNIEKLPQTIPDNVQLTDTEAGLEADIYVVLVKHKEFKSLHLNTEKVINTCGL